MTLDERIDAALDREAAVDLLKRAVDRESVTGKEGNFVSLLNAEMKARKLEPVCEEFLPGRPNIEGVRRGSSGGKRLLFIGHTDTVHARDWPAYWRGTKRENPFVAQEVDGALWGRGVADLKGGIAAALSALDTLDSAGVRLNGDLAFAFVGDEESGEPGTGVSAGIDRWSARMASSSDPRPDFAIYVEPTKLDVYSAQIGFFIADVTIRGKSAYFGRPEQGVDALRAGHRVLDAVWAYADHLNTLPPHQLTGPARLLVTGIEAGGNVAVPGNCTFTVIGSLRPGDDLDENARAFDKVVRDVGLPKEIEIEIEYPSGRDHPLGGSPAEIDRDRAEVIELASALSEVKAGAGTISGAPYWSESPFIIQRLGCPTVYCGPGDIACCHTSEEHLQIDEYFAAIRAYARFAARYCGSASA